MRSTSSRNSNYQRPQSAKTLFNHTQPYFESELVENKLIETKTPVKKKLRVIRWLTKKIGEYDVDNDFWTSVDC